ncbi:MAG: glycosyltransferase family 87 protein [Terracidiphilus sp.]
MIKARTDGLYLMILGTAVFLLLGFALENAAPVSTADFRLMYYSARCLLEHHDPYNPNELQQIYRAEGGESSHDTSKIRTTETQYIYPPTAFSITIPFAILPFWAAQILWLLATAGSLILGAFLMWEVSAQYAPLLSGALIGLTLANCELFLAIAGPGGIAIGLCIAAAWCFVRERFVILAVFGLAISLMLKPHDSVLVWLYFFLAGGTFRKRAVQAALVIVVWSLPVLAWTSYVSPHWVHGLLTNLAANSAHGGLSDPGSASAAGHGIAMIISLQTVFSFFRDDPRFYNSASYVVCGVLLVVWAIGTLRTRSSLKTAWFAIAPIAALSMLPIYHRLDDAKLLLLTVPACAMLWVKGGPIGRLAALLNVLQILFTSGIPWAIFFRLLKHFSTSISWLPSPLLIAMQVFPVPIILLAAGCFYLYVYVMTYPGAADGNHTAFYANPGGE